MRVVKRSVEVDAVQLVRTTAGEGVSFAAGECPDWVVTALDHGAIEPVVAGAVQIDAGDTIWLIVHTLEGDMYCRPGDWLMRGVDGELYPCADSIFRRTYLAAPSAPAALAVAHRLPKPDVTDTATRPARPRLRQLLLIDALIGVVCGAAAGFIIRMFS